MACFDVDGGSSSSHGQTDTETAAFSLAPTSSHGQTAQAAPGNTPGSKLSGINFEVSLSIRSKYSQKYKENAKPLNSHRIKSTSIFHTFIIYEKETEKKNSKKNISREMHKIRMNVSVCEIFTVGLFV